jgi:hypothetical protein
VERLERDLNRQTTKLDTKTKELSEARTKSQEQQSRADSLEMEQMTLKKEVETLEKIKIEREQQLEGRDNALKQLNSARNTFEKVFQSKIDRLMDEKISAEQFVNSELARIQARHEQEMRKTVEDCTASLVQAQLTQESIRTEEYKERCSTADNECQRMLEEMQKLSLVLSGYAELARQQEGKKKKIEQIIPLLYISFFVRLGNLNLTPSFPLFPLFLFHTFRKRYNL